MRNPATGKCQHSGAPYNSTFHFPDRAHQPNLLLNLTFNCWEFLGRVVGWKVGRCRKSAVHILLWSCGSWGRKCRLGVSAVAGVRKNRGKRWARLVPSATAVVVPRRTGTASWFCESEGWLNALQCPAILQSLGMSKSWIHSVIRSLSQSFRPAVSWEFSH